MVEGLAPTKTAQTPVQRAGARNGWRDFQFAKHALKSYLIENTLQ